MNLDYILNENKSDNGEATGYGVTVKKTTVLSDGNIKTESASAENISYNKSEVLKLIDILKNGTVTPMTLKEIVEEFVVDRLCFSNAD